VGLGVAVVLFAYDGWVDVSHVAGEVESPRRSLPLGLGLGVTFVTLLCLVVNYAYLRVVPLESMRADPSGVAGLLARAAFGQEGGRIVELLILVSILGAMGGLVMTLPRLYYAAASQYASSTESGGPTAFFRLLSSVSSRGVPVGAVLFTALLATLALVTFSTFRRITTFFVVPLQVVNILMVASVFRLRRRTALAPDAYLAPGYPWLPAVYVFVLVLFLLSALVYNPVETLAGAALTATGLPFYLWIRGKERA
jgi:APA family basic amino acid/polyamine antiporter